ncbi:hypothetical protein HB976_05280 [Yersinia mollaretii]|uniref:Uncharacterized protein n=1 Tax=Yersinia mollaretii TaxID=33060 RepID=A0AA36PKA8_YERMO|nr:hypothetical protein [Yersinia mollaretii]MDA5526970.1 hypothetical protein [Yersinia mollaretii]MDA5534445.1 hypothetical protein [Yersinia mollaretii]MDR7872365.1 hypothetical protein [Yersinia mollaretii]NIL02369.1 hypothetical protein [Yersinia mollaretii]PHZ31810.1 hypothetical protein CS537_10145 [Yersinia mollaretii]
MQTDTHIVDRRMDEIIVNLDFSDMGEDDCLQLAAHCEAARAGLSDCLDFIGDSLHTFADHNVLAFEPTSLYQLGQSLNAISALIPTLNKLEQRVRADILATKSSANTRTGR